jgi:CRP-like cAMP-binding protein
MRRSSAAAGGPDPTVRNRILHRAAPATLLRLRQHLRPVALGAREVVYAAGEPARDVYFLESGLCSLRTSTRAGQSVEAVSISHEGMIGLHALLGAAAIPADVVVQLAGQALAVGADVVRREMVCDAGLRDAIQRYAHGLIVQAMQSVGCSRLHTLEERFCRWLLGALDSTDGDRIVITQELLAGTLGVRRPSLTLAAGQLQDAGTISYRRGEVRVLNRAALERSACECYGIIRRALTPTRRRATRGQADDA